MATFEIIQLDLHNEYKPKIRGLGEIYEEMSVTLLQKKLKEKFKEGILFLSSNKRHRGRGLTIKELELGIKQKGYRVLSSGYVDSPPWASNPSESTVNKNFSLHLIFLAKMIFWFLIQLEFIWQGNKNSHMIYILVKK